MNTSVDLFDTTTDIKLLFIRTPLLPPSAKWKYTTH